MHKIILTDCVTWMRDNLQERSIDLSITSPPYKDEDGWTKDLMYGCFYNIYRGLKDGGLFFMNFGHLAEDKFRPFTTAQIAMDAGFQLNETIIWVKNHYRPIQGNKRLNNLSEFVFLFFKKYMPDLDRLAIGVPYTDKSNAKRFAGGRDLKCRGNVWYIPYETITNKDEKLHNDRFPVELPLTCIKLSGIKSGVVIDPFMGSATTGVAAYKAGLDFLGLEKNPAHVLTSTQRLNLQVNLQPAS